MTVKKKSAALSSYIDHTLLAPDATRAGITRLCAEARRYRFAAVCVNPSYVPLCVSLLAGSGVRVATVIGFPLGASTTAVKVAEARDAMASGADELDMVINIGMVKSGDPAGAAREIGFLREATRGKILKVIIETTLLTRSEKIKISRLALKAGADFVKTSTGTRGGATVEDVRLIRSAVGPSTGIKASGGIRTREAALGLIAAGATRIGTSSGVAITKGEGSHARAG